MSTSRVKYLREAHASFFAITRFVMLKKVMSESTIETLIQNADSRLEETNNALIRRLLGNIMNLFEMVTVDKQQRAAAKTQLQKLLSNIISKQHRSDLRAILAALADQQGVSIKFTPLKDSDEVN